MIQIKLEQEISAFYSLLAKSTGTEAQSVFRNLCLRLLEAYEEGVLGPKELAYEIAGALQFDMLDTSGKEVARLAGELELPDAHISGNPEEKLQRLIEHIKKL